MPRLVTVIRALAVSVAALLMIPVAAGAVLARPEPKAPRKFVALSDVDRTILQEMRYFTAHNFVGEPIDGHRRPVRILTRPTAEALHKAQRTLLGRFPVSRSSLAGRR